MVFIWSGRSAFQISREWPFGLFVYLDVCDCEVLGQNRIVKFHREISFQISCDWLAGLLVYLDICDCQFLFQERAINFHMKSK